MEELAGISRRLHFVYKFVIRLSFRILLANNPEKPYPFVMTQSSLWILKTERFQTSWNMNIYH